MVIKLYNDDCLKVLPTLAKDSIDLVIVDLPYGQTAHSWDIIIDLTEMWNQLKRICKEKTAILFFTTTRYGTSLITSNLKWFRYDLVWQKSVVGGFVNAKKMPLRTHEMVYVFYKKLPTYNPQMVQGEPYVKTAKERVKKSQFGNLISTGRSCLTGMRYPKSILTFGNGNNNNIHPTQKPNDLLEWLIKTYSNEKDTVLDFTMGSGSTGLACKNLNRNFIGIEMDKTFFDKCLIKDNLETIV